ncbi:terminase large subunit [Sarcina ventriculi]|uniref:terminase large subunit n=1 Tax=Sarcina ventriculi TaxID=1267 RepID=UPI001C103458|nr:terminase TerL endonuclease subunit [Sarcina ventriculi]MBU5323390.1 terminase large subunit [Sarcina ventriculi]
MTLKEELIKYCNDCLDDKIISCEKHKWACLRLLNDFNNENTEDFNYYWNEEEAQKIVKWFSYLRHSKGVLAGQPIILNTWQKFCLCQIYGWRNINTDYKRFNKSFIEVARKNAKSQMESGVALYEIATQSTKNKELYEAYCAGVKRDQSKVIFDECVVMLKGSPLRTKFKVTRDRITHIKTNSYLKALCKEDGKKGDGTNPALLVIDEYHQHATTEFYDLGYGSNTKESLLMIITTAGVDLNYPCFTQEYTYCSRVLNPDIDTLNDNYFIDILELDNNDDIENEENWKKANPIRMTYDKGIEKIRSDFKVAREIPEKMPTFMTKCLNIWVQAKDNGYMNMAKWKDCEVKSIPYDLTGRDVIIGVDLSAKIDLTSVSFIFKINDTYVVKSHSFIPNREKLIERTRKDKVPYDAWERQGFLSVTNSAFVNQYHVIDYIINTCKKNDWNIYQVCYDPSNANLFATTMDDMGYEMVEIYQSHQSLNECTHGFREQVYDKKIIYEYNPLLTFAMGNAIIKQNNGKIKIDKDASKKRIDPVDATLFAFKMATYYEDMSSYNRFINDWLDE